MTTARFELAGVQYRLMQYQKANVAINNELALVPEPTNQFDPHAIAVHKDNVCIGYVPRKDNKDIYAYVMAGQAKCVVEAAWPHGCTVRVEMP